MALMPSLVDRHFSIYLGGVAHARPLVYRTLSIDLVINCIPRTDPHVLRTSHTTGCIPSESLTGNPEVVYLNMLDHCDQDLETPIKIALMAMRAGVAGGKRILVHCHAGISRSSSIVIGWIMMTRNLTFNQALMYVRRRHPSADPNVGFCLVLERIEDEIRRGFGEIVAPGGDLRLSSDSGSPSVPEPKSEPIFTVAHIEPVVLTLPPRRMKLRPATSV